MSTPDFVDRARGCLHGLAIGDAVGTTAEFRPRGTFKTVTDMVGGGPFDLKPGQWTDDTSMALCLAESLSECRDFNARDQIERYCRWWRQGHLSSTGSCFDIGITTSAALLKFERTGEPYAGSIAPGTAGNGSIMRLAPIPIFWAHDLSLAAQWGRESSRTTHGAPECLDACQALAVLLNRLMSGVSKEDALARWQTESVESPRVQALIEGSFREKTENQVYSSGYVIHTLEAALWSFYHTDSFEEAILRVVNLGDDADSTGAVCGQIAGAYYGLKGIPPHWLERLALRETIDALCLGLLSSANSLRG